MKSGWVKHALELLELQEAISSNSYTIIFLMVILCSDDSFI